MRKLKHQNLFSFLCCCCNSYKLGAKAATSATFQLKYSGKPCVGICGWTKPQGQCVVCLPALRYVSLHVPGSLWTEGLSVNRKEPAGTQFASQCRKHFSNQTSCLSGCVYEAVNTKRTNYRRRKSSRIFPTPPVYLFVFVWTSFYLTLRPQGPPIPLSLVNFNLWHEHRNKETLFYYFYPQQSQFTYQFVWVNPKEQNAESSSAIWQILSIGFILFRRCNILELVSKICCF